MATRFVIPVEALKNKGTEKLLSGLVLKLPVK